MRGWAGGGRRRRGTIRLHRQSGRRPVAQGRRGTAGAGPNVSPHLVAGDGSRHVTHRGGAEAHTGSGLEMPRIQGQHNLWQDSVAANKGVDEGPRGRQPPRRAQAQGGRAAYSKLGVKAARTLSHWQGEAAR